MRKELFIILLLLSAAGCALRPALMKDVQYEKVERTRADADIAGLTRRNAELISEITRLQDVLEQYRVAAGRTARDAGTTSAVLNEKADIADQEMYDMSAEAGALPGILSTLTGGMVPEGIMALLLTLVGGDNLRQRKKSKQLGGLASTLVGCDKGESLKIAQAHPLMPHTQT